MRNQQRGSRSGKHRQHYVPALSTHEQALLEHTAETLNRINQESAAATEAVNQARSVAIQAGLDDAVSAAARTLSEALSAVTHG